MLETLPIFYMPHSCPVPDPSAGILLCEPVRSILPGNSGTSDAR